MYGRLLNLATGVILVAVIVTAVVYLWALNANTVFERKTPLAPVSTSNE